MTKAPISLLAVLGIMMASAFGAKTPTILALGDSITSGGKTFTCYRQVLLPELRKRGVAVEFIGPNKDMTSAHAGYGGHNTSALLGSTKKIYRRYPADIVLLHSGHNSFDNDKPVPGIIRDTEALIKGMHGTNPKVTVLLAQVIPAGKLPKYSYIPALNKELAALAKRLVAGGHHVVLVNQTEDFDWRTDTIADKVHPNAAGAKKMADKWLAALLPVLEKKDP